jgi:hypothetical protein
MEHIAGGVRGVIGSQDLVARIAKESKTKPAIPVHRIAFWIQIEREVHRVPRGQRDAEPVLLGRISRVACATHPAIRR